MQEFSSELGANYNTYTFGYTQYATREPHDALEALYGKGYLPYTGSPEADNVFYRARSARVALEQFELTSENRRIAKKFDGQFTKQRVAVSTIAEDEAFYAFCLAYFAALHGERAMPRARLAYILRCGLITSVSVYRKAGAIAAYVLEVADDHIGHYWFSFYDIAYRKQSLGLWLMLDHVRDAKARGQRHYYLGTVYGEKALYKTNFEPLEWWDGSTWNTDSGLLRAHGRQDGGRVLPLTDTWKEGIALF